ncbi:hypothetical protein SOVF_100670 isoform A [Spinacia oleracea]|nr:hypothetical protein SOVF_100670 isoform A [Spinacia oleracea]
MVSDEIIVDLLSKRLEPGEVKGEPGYIINEFPRTIRQSGRSSGKLNLLQLGWLVS